jgi:hypothetical protein
MGLSFGFRGAVSPSACTCGAATLGVFVLAIVDAVVGGVGVGVAVGAGTSEIGSVAGEGSPSVQAERVRLMSAKMNRAARKPLEHRDFDMRRRVAGAQRLAENSYSAADRFRSNSGR